MSQPEADPSVERLAAEVAKRVPAACELALRLRAHPETGLQEEQACG